MNIISIGLLGASKIAPGAIIEPAREHADASVTAVAASDFERAGRYAAQHQIDRVHQSYQALIDDPELDLIYNALPPSMHMEWSIKALQAGKHVLCEKPFALNAEQSQAMVDAARQHDRLLIEAFHHRYHPLFMRVMELTEQRAIGKLRRLSGVFSVPISERQGELRYRPELGGGALMDLGCYPLHWVRTVVGTEPTVVAASAEFHAGGVDLATTAELVFDDGSKSGIPATISCSMTPDHGRFEAELTLIGDSGEIIVTNPLAPQNGHNLELRSDGTNSSEQIDSPSTYHHQLAAVVESIEQWTNGASNRQPLTGGEDAIANMRAIDAIYRLARAP